MIANITKNNRSAVLVAILALFVVLAGTVVAFSDNTSAAVDTTGMTGVTGENIGNVFSTSNENGFYLSENIEINSGTTVDLKTNVLYLNGHTLTVNGGTIKATAATGDVKGGTIDETDSVNSFIVNNGTVENVTFTNFNMAVVNSIYGADVTTIKGCTFIPSTGSVSAVYINMTDKVTEVTIQDCTLGSGYTEKALNLALYENGKVKIKVINCGETTVNVYGPQSGNSEDSPLSFGDSTTTVTETNIIDFDNNTSIKELNMAQVGNGNKPTVTIDKATEITEVTGSGDMVLKAPFETETIEDTVGTTVDKEAGGSFEISGSLALGDTVNADLTIPDYAYLTDNLTIPEGKTLTISSNATLNMINFDIIVNGTLVVERNGVVTSTDNDGNSIVLTRTGSIQNSGIIGDINTVTITGQNPDGDSVGQVVMKGVSGVNVSLIRSSGNYIMVVSGDISKISSVDNATLTIADVTINSDMTINRNVKLTIGDISENETDKVLVDSNVTFTNNGVMEITGAFELSNGSSFVVGGSTNGKIVSQIGEVEKGNTITGDVKGITLNNNVKGITVSVDRVTIPSEIAGGTATVEQRMYITGTVSNIADPNKDTNDAYIENGKITVDAMTMYVIDTLYIPEEITVSGGIFDVSKAGTIQLKDPENNSSSISYIGASYVVESTVDGVSSVTEYYTSFANAMADISAADNNEITISGDFDINENYTLSDGQSILGTANVTVGENATITVNDGALISNTAFTLIEGQVVVNDGGSYRPSSNSDIYAVVSENKETNTTIYSGFKVALDKAVSGDIISVVGNATYSGNMTIISGVIVNLNDNIDLNVTGNLTVQTDAELNLGATSILTVGTVDKTNAINNAGEINATEGRINAAEKVNMYSTGTVTTVDGGIGSGVVPNSAYYNDAGIIVYTTVANAAAFAAENDLSGINATGVFSESGDITLTVPLTIDNDSKVSLGNVTINQTCIQSATSSDGEQGTYSATVNGLSGTGSETVTTTIKVVDTTAKIETTSVLEASGEASNATSISAVVGNITVSAGTVSLDGGFTINATDTLEVVSGATLVLGDGNISIGDAPEGMDYNNNLINAGTILIQGEVALASDIILDGDVTVNNGGQLTVGMSESNTHEPYKLTVTGTLTVSDEEDNEGTLRVDGVLYVGAQPEMLGESATGTVVGTIIVGNTATTYVVVFDGASISDATISDGASTDVKSTSFIVNEEALATVYTMGGTSISVINGVVSSLKNLDETDRETVEWYSGETKVANESTIGTYDELSSEIDYASVDITLSIGAYITLSVDNIIVDSLPNGLTIGTHTVSATVNPGYTGDVTITFNGQTVTDGTIEVTSDMIGETIVLSATGQLSANSPTINVDGGNGNSNDGLGLTDYLLIILVILIVIMAIMVAARLMRS